MRERLGAGIYPMQYAFFDRSGRLDRAAMRRQAEAAVENGAHGDNATCTIAPRRGS